MKPQERLKLKERLRLFRKRYRGSPDASKIISRLSRVILQLKYVKVRLTTRCNCNCQMCYWKVKDEQLDLALVKKIIDQVALLGVQTLNFTGGEPTIYPGFTEILRRAKKRGLRTTVSTNGFLSDKALKFLCANANAVDISLDSYTPEMHDKIRGREGVFAAVLHSLLVLNKGKVPLYINVTVRPDNYRSIHRIIPLLSGLVKSVDFHLVDTSDNHLKYLEFDKKQLRDFYLNEVPLIIKEAIRHNIKYKIQPLIEQGKPLKNKRALQVILEGSSYPRQLKSLLKADTAPCLLPHKTLRINPDGEVSPCCTLDNVKGLLGNIHHQDFIDIVSSDKYFNFIQKAKPAKGLCAQCGREYRNCFYGKTRYL